MPNNNISHSPIPLYIVYPSVQQNNSIQKSY